MKILRRIRRRSWRCSLSLSLCCCGSSRRRCCASARTTPPRSSAPMYFSPDAILTRCCASTCRRPASRFSSSCGSRSTASTASCAPDFLASSAMAWPSIAPGQRLHRAAGRQARCVRAGSQLEFHAAHRTAGASPPAFSSGSLAGRRTPSRRTQAIDALIKDPVLAGPGARAIVVVDHGRIVGEYYAPGFAARVRRCSAGP